MIQTTDWDLLCNRWDETPMTLNQDPLAAAVAAWRRAVDTNYRVRWPSLESQEPLDQDHDLARQIRRYYLGKISMSALRAMRPLTDFQQALYHMLDTQRYQQGHLGMLYRLPYFYAEDQAHQELQISMQSADYQLGQRDTVLSAQRRVLRSRRRREVMEYWWSDSDHRAIQWPVRLDNPLRSMVDALFEQGQVHLRFHGRVMSLEHTGWRYLQIESPELA